MITIPLYAWYPNPYGSDSINDLANGALYSSNSVLWWSNATFYEQMEAWSLIRRFKSKILKSKELQVVDERE